MAHGKGVGNYQSGIVHSLDTTTAKVHDSQVWLDLLHGKETSVWADKGYVSAARETAFSGVGKFWGVMRKAPKGSGLHPIDKDINRIIAKVRARVEHLRIPDYPAAHSSDIRPPKPGYPATLV